MPLSSRVEVGLPNGIVEHKYVYVQVAPIPARRIERIPFSHPRLIFPLLRVNPLEFLANEILRQWRKFNQLLKSCFSNGKGVDNEWTLDDLLNGVSASTPSISISPIPSPPSLIVVFPAGGKQHTVRISVLENGEIDLDVDDNLKERASVLIDNAGIGVGIEFLRKELQ